MSYKALEIEEIPGGFTKNSQKPKLKVIKITKVELNFDFNIFNNF